MIKFTLLFLATLLAEISYSQKAEISFHVNSGLFSFGGGAATRNSFVLISDIYRLPSYTNNPYGMRSGLSIGFGLQIQKVSPFGWITGAQLGFESLASKVNIHEVADELPWTVVDGRTILRNKFINLNPFVGRKFEWVQGIRTDLLLGMDIAACLVSKEEIDLKTSLVDNFTTSSYRSKPNFDIRPRFEMRVYAGKTGFSVGYSLGITNYTSKLVGADRYTTARYLRLGISHQIW